MLAVATVIMNRVASPAYPNNLHDVIYQSGQFAPTWNGSLNKVLKQGASSTAYQVAQDALAGARHSAVINCLQFRSASTGVSGVNVGEMYFSKLHITSTIAREAATGSFLRMHGDKNKPQYEAYFYLILFVFIHIP